jgi:hypothetical protein
MFRKVSEQWLALSFFFLSNLRNILFNLIKEYFYSYAIINRNIILIFKNIIYYVFLYKIVSFI